MRRQLLVMGVVIGGAVAAWSARVEGGGWTGGGVHEPANPLPAVSGDEGKQRAGVDQARLMGTLRAVAKGRAARGTVAEQRGLAETEEWIEGELKGMGYAVRKQPLSWNLKAQREFEDGIGAKVSRQAVEEDVELSARTWHNLIVEVPGREHGEEVLILGAHFDAVPGTPGADDNGTGTAALLEIALVLKGRELKRTVRMIFFNLEEVGLKGSAEYVKDWRSRKQEHGETIIGMVSLEMLGYYSDEPGSQRSPIPKIEGVFDPPTVGDFIALVTIQRHSAFCRRLDAEMRRAVPELKTGIADFPPIAPPDFMRSDHAPFLLAGLPAVMMTDTSNFRNPHYHRATDTVETLDAERFTMVVRALAGAAAAIAGEK